MRKALIPILAGVMLLIALTLAWKGSLIEGWLVVSLATACASLVILDLCVMRGERKRRIKRLIQFKIIKSE